MGFNGKEFVAEERNQESNAETEKGEPICLTAIGAKCLKIETEIIQTEKDTKHDVEGAIALVTVGMIPKGTVQQDKGQNPQA